MEHLEYGNIISPQFPILLVLDVLYAHYLQIDRSKKEALHEYTIQTLSLIHIFLKSLCDFQRTCDRSAYHDRPYTRL